MHLALHSQRDIWALRGDTETCSSAATFGARPTEMLAAHAACCQTAWLPTEIAVMALHFCLTPCRALLGSAPSFFWQNPFRVPGKPFFKGASLFFTMKKKSKTGSPVREGKISSDRGLRWRIRLGVSLGRNKPRGAGMVPAGGIPGEGGQLQAACTRKLRGA